MWLSREAGHRATALVTGASVGLGLEIARELLAHSFDVWVCARSEVALAMLTGVPFQELCHNKKPLARTREAQSGKRLRMATDQGQMDRFQ